MSLAMSWKCLSSSPWKRVMRILSSTVGACRTHCPKTSAVATSRPACLSMSVSTIFRYASSGIASFVGTIVAMRSPAPVMRAVHNASTLEPSLVAVYDSGHRAIQEGGMLAYTGEEVLDSVHADGSRVRIAHPRHAGAVTA